VALKYGPTAPQIANIGIFWYKFAQKGYTPLCDFLYTKFGLGKWSQIRAFTPNFIVVALKMWVYSPQNREKW